jgi:hypothetical protein
VPCSPALTSALLALLVESHQSASFFHYYRPQIKQHEGLGSHPFAGRDWGNATPQAKSSNTTPQKHFKVLPLSSSCSYDLDESELKETEHRSPPGQDGYATPPKWHFENENNNDNDGSEVEDEQEHAKGDTMGGIEPSSLEAPALAAHDGLSPSSFVGGFAEMRALLDSQCEKAEERDSTNKRLTEQVQQLQEELQQVKSAVAASNEEKAKLESLVTTLQEEKAALEKKNCDLRSRNLVILKESHSRLNVELAANKQMLEEAEKESAGGD